MLLPWLIFLPIIGGLFCWLSALISANLPRYMALITLTVTLFLTLYLWHVGEYSIITEERWNESFVAEWIPRFGIKFQLAMDGLSILMVMLTALLTLFSVMCSWKDEIKQSGLFFLCITWMGAGVIGVFTATDLFLFFFFWEMMLIPMYFLIAVWGHKDSGSSSRFSGATKFLIYTQSSGLIMLVSILALAFDYYHTYNTWTFDYNILIYTTFTSFMNQSAAEFMIMLGFFIAFAVKMPIFPLHGWLADAHAQAPTAASVDISGLLLKTAAYGLLRFCLPIFPNASADFAPIAIGLGLISIFYGAWMAYAQTDMKRMIAYTSISHMGLVMIAIYSSNILAYQGAVIQMIAHGLSAAGMFIICGQLYDRIKTRDMREMGGLWGRIYYLPALALVFAVATLGMPGTGNFVGEFMMFFGAFERYPKVIIIAAFGVVFASVYSLMYMQRSFYGEAKSATPLSPLSFRELSMLFVLMALVILLGIYPQPVLDTSLHVMDGVQGVMDTVTTPTITEE